MDNELKRETLQSMSGFKTLLPFILIISCFALWGFANDINGPIVQACSRIFRLNMTQSALVQVVVNLGYFIMAVPAAVFIQRHSFKGGVLMGLGLLTVGALMFLPARFIGTYTMFLLSFFILSCGQSFLETSCNPYIYCMGPEETGIQRLNIAQAFNPIGALLGLYIAMQHVQAKLLPLTAEARQSLSNAQFEMVKDHDMGILIQPYIFLAIVAVFLLIVIWRNKMPKTVIDESRSPKKAVDAMKELFSMRNYRDGVIAMFFYSGAQVACFTFILQYSVRVFLTEGMEVTAAELVAQRYGIIAVVFLTASRFLSIWIMRYVYPARLLAVVAVLAFVLAGGAMFFPNRNGIYCLLAVCACMSVMFPTIFGISLRGVGDNMKFAGAGLIMGMVGGSILPPLQALIIDSGTTVLGMSAVNVSFVIPLVGFAFIALYGHHAYVRHYIKNLSA